MHSILLCTIIRGSLGYKPSNEINLFVAGNWGGKAVDNVPFSFSSAHSEPVEECEPVEESEPDKLSPLP